MGRNKQEDPFVDGTHSNATRIPDELWNELKPEILKKYKDEDATLDETMDYMVHIWLKHEWKEPPT